MISITRLAVFAIIAFIQPAASDTFCSELVQLQTAPWDRDLTVKSPISDDMSANCQTALAPSGITSLHCAWPFDYRSTDATNLFETLVLKLPNCLGTNTVSLTDDLVNHPDFYDHRIFRIEKIEIGVSIKDKSALQQTYVFLRMQRPL